MLPSEAFARTYTDKIVTHGYGGFYDFVFASLLSTRSPVRVLEIGVSAFGFGSGHAWALMPSVEFVGIDIMALSRPLGSGTFIQGDAYSKAFVDRLYHEHEQFDLVIDDGTHAVVDQIFFFENYFDICRDGGVMSCEDVKDTTFRNGDYNALSSLPISFIRPSYFRGLDYSNLLVLFKNIEPEPIQHENPLYFA